MTKAIRGVKQVNESIIQEGRSLIFTEPTGTIDMKRVPDGALHINKQTGQLSAKYHEQDEFVPLRIAEDGSVLPPTEVVFYTEEYEIIETPEDRKKWGYFRYKFITGKDEFGVEDFEIMEGEVVEEKGLEFHLKRGYYKPHRGFFHATLNNTIYVDEVSGGLEETDPDHFILKYRDGASSFPVGTRIRVKYYHTAQRGRKRGATGTLWFDLSNMRDKSGDYYSSQTMHEVESKPYFYINKATTQGDALKKAAAAGHKLAIVVEDNDEINAAIKPRTSRFQLSSLEEPDFERGKVDENGNAVEKCAVGVILTNDEWSRLHDGFDAENAHPRIMLDYNVTVENESITINNDYNYFYRTRAHIASGDSLLLDIWEVFRYGKDAMDLMIEVRIQDSDLSGKAPNSKYAKQGQYISAESVSLVARDNRYVEIYNTYEDELTFDILVR